MSIRNEEWRKNERKEGWNGKERKGKTDTWIRRANKRLT